MIGNVLVRTTLLMSTLALVISLGTTYSPLQVADARAAAEPPKDNVIDGELYPAGYTPFEIKNGVYPRDFYPNTEKLGPNEMRIVALGTGMPNQRKSQASACWLVELGNGDKFLFDLGTGSMANVMSLMIPADYLTKVFVSHLHTDHVGDMAAHVGEQQEACAAGGRLCVKVSQISNLAKDIARGLSVIAVRVVEVIPGKSVIGLEIPNNRREMVYLREVLNSRAYRDASSPLTLVLGKDISGEPIVANLAKMPHLLIAGTTGSGKSVAINTMIFEGPSDPAGRQVGNAASAAVRLSARAASVDRS